MPRPWESINCGGKKIPHICVEVFRKTFNAVKTPNRKCYIQRYERKFSDKDYLFIFVDLKTQQTLVSKPDKNVPIK